MHKPLVVVLLLGLGVIFGITLAFSTSQPYERPAIEWLETPRSLGQFSLETETGEFDNRWLAEHWTIVMFGFLHCPDVCPTGLSQLADLAESLRQASLDKEVRLVFVSVDPGRDSVADVGRYVKHFDPSICGVTGESEQLAQFAGDLGIQFKVTADSDDYTVAHSTTYSITGPGAALRGRFRPEFAVPDLVRSLKFKLRGGGI